MCIIIVRHRGTKPISNHYLKTGIKKNPHGWGFAFFDEKTKQLKMYKSLNMNEVIPTIRDMERDDLEFIVHLRYATKGAVNKDNAHPYYIKGVGVMFHNGTMKKLDLWAKNMSDTWHLAKKIERRVAVGKDLHDTLEKYKDIIDDNRIAIMTEDGGVQVLGALTNGYSTWNNIGGNWFSNRYAITEYTTTTSHTYKPTDTSISSWELIRLCEEEGLEITWELVDKLWYSGMERLCQEYPEIVASLIHNDSYKHTPPPQPEETLASVADEAQEIQQLADGLKQGVIDGTVDEDELEQFLNTSDNMSLEELRLHLEERWGIKLLGSGDSEVFEVVDAEEDEGISDDESLHITVESGECCE
jgi:predicted glutamine amidotransferase